MHVSAAEAHELNRALADLRELWERLVAGTAASTWRFVRGTWLGEQRPDSGVKARAVLSSQHGPR
jgi:hypothetical protein